MIPQNLSRTLDAVLEHEFPKALTVGEVFAPAMVEIIYKEVMATRKCVGDDDFTYSPVVKESNGKTYTIQATHIKIGEVMSHAKNSCNKCYGSGKKIMLMGKHEIKKPEDFMMLASSSLKGVTEEQQKIIIEREKQSKNWKVLLPCPCTIKGMIKKGRRIISNDLHNIVAEITCAEKIEV